MNKYLLLFFFTTCISFSLICDEQFLLKENIIERKDFSPNNLLTIGFKRINNILIINGSYLFSLVDFELVETLPPRNYFYVVNSDGNIYYRKRSDNKDYTYNLLKKNTIEDTIFTKDEIESIKLKDIYSRELYSKNKILGLLHSQRNPAWTDFDLVLLDLKSGEYEKIVKGITFDHPTIHGISYDGRYYLVGGTFIEKVYDVLNWDTRLTLDTGNFDEHCGGFLYNSLLYTLSPVIAPAKPNSISIFNIDGQKIISIKITGGDGPGIESMWIDYEAEIGFIHYIGSKHSYFIDVKPIKKMLEEKGYNLEKRNGKIVSNDCSLYMYPRTNIDKIRLIPKGTIVTVFEKRNIDRQEWHYIRDDQQWMGWIKKEQFEFTSGVIRDSGTTASTSTSDASLTSITASSTLTEKHDKNMYQPIKVLDGKPDTGWMESVEGNGVGQWLEMSFEKPVTAGKLVVSPGWFDQRYWIENNRIKKLRIEVNGETLRGLFTDAMTPQSVSLGKMITFSKIRFVVEDVYKTTKWDDTCIAEIEFFLGDTKLDIDISRFKEQLKVVPE